MTNAVQQAVQVVGSDMGEAVRVSSETLKLKLIEHADSFVDAIARGADFLSDQVPSFLQQLAQEFIWYYRAVHTSQLVFGLFLFVMGILGVRFALKLMGNEDPDKYKWAHDGRAQNWSDIGGVVCVFGGIGGAILAFFSTLVTAMECVGPFFKVWLAPRLYVVEYLVKSLQKMGG